MLCFHFNWNGIEVDMMDVSQLNVYSLLPIVVGRCNQ